MAQDATRRGVLAAAVLAASGLPLLVSGCKGIGGLGTPPKPLPDVAVATDAIAGERALIARYQAVIAAMPSLAGQLRPLLAQHTEHLAGLTGRLSDPNASNQPTPTGGASHRGGGAGGSGAGRSAGSGATGNAGKGATTGASASAPPVPSTPAAALASLRSAEDAASASLLGHLAAVSPSFAQLIASIAASESTHAQILRGHGQAR